MSLIELLVNGRSLKPPVGPRLRGEQVWVPVGPVVEALGGRVDYSERGQVLVLRFGRESLKLRLGELDQAVMLGSTAMSPADTISACLGAQIKWQPEQQRIEIILQGKPVVRRPPEEESAESEVQPERKPPEKVQSARGDQERSLDFWLRDLQGQPVSLNQYLGKRMGILIWASWLSSPHTLASWQVFFTRHPHDTFIGVVIEAQGKGPVQPLVNRAKVTFLMLVDECNFLGDALGLKSLPTVALVDEQGKIKGTETNPQAIARWLTTKLNKQGSNRKSKAQNKRKPLEGVASIERSLRTDSENGELRLRLGDALFGGGEYARAARQYRRAGNLLSKLAIPHFRLGVCLLRLGNRRQALTCWKSAVKLDPENELISRQVASLEQRLKKSNQGAEKE